MLSIHCIEKMLGLQDVQIEKIENREEKIEIYLSMRVKSHVCPCCGKTTEQIHDYRQQSIKDIPGFGEQGANIVSYTLLKGLDEFLYFEFTELLKQGLRVRKCRHCGKYFVLKSKHETFYCDRISSGNKSCKVIGNKLEYQKRVATYALLQDYERKYKANHAQFGRKSEKEITADEMGKAKVLQKQWSKQAQKMRKAYLEGDISAIEFGEWLGNR